MVVMDDVVVMALCRHGLTEANKKRAYLGWTDSPLCVAFSPFTSEFDGYFSSDLGRCLLTMKGYFPNVVPIELRELREMHFGDFEGLSYEELKDNQEYKDWIHQYESIAPPNGESFKQFVSRVELGWKMATEQMERNKWKRSFFVTHAGVIRQFLVSYAPVKKDYWDWNVSHDCYYELTFSKKGFFMGERAISLIEIPIV